MHGTWNETRSLNVQARATNLENELTNYRSKVKLAGVYLVAMETKGDSTELLIV